MKAPKDNTDSAPSNRRIGNLVRKLESYQTEIAEQQQKLEKVRNQLRDTYSRYTDLYELAPVGFLALDKQARISEINAKGAALLGFRSAWLIGRPFLVFISRDDIQPFLSFLSHSTRTLKQENMELILNASGHHIPVHISLRTSVSDEMIAHRMTIVDLSDVKKNERRLRTSLDGWLAVVKNAPDVMLTVESSGKILLANRSVWGRSAAALMKSSIFSYIPDHESAEFRQCFNEVFNSGKSRVCQVPGAGGLDQSWHEFSFGAVQDLELEDQTTTTTTTIQIRDISEERNAKEKLRKTSETMREFAAGIEAVREEERARVAREIHDELGQALTVTKLDLSWLQSKPPRNVRELRAKVRSMMQHVDNTIECMRKIVSELRPSILDDLGLIPAIEWQVKEFQKRTGIRTRLRSNVEDADLTPDRSAAVFRVVQEALTNVMRHAKAKSVQVELRKEKGLLKISVSDDGQGIPDSAIRDLKSLGIVGMRERIYRIGGKFKIYSTRGCGTRVEIVMGI